jgi:hypothetical protein
MQLNDGMLERRDLDPFCYHLQWWCPSWFLWILTIWLLIEAEPLLVFFVEELILKTSKAGWSVSAKNVKRSWSWMLDQVLLKLLVNKANFLWGIQLFWALARLACTCLKICFFSNWFLDREDATICCLLMRSCLVCCCKMCKAHLAYSAPNLSCGCLLIELANPLSALMVLKQRTRQYLIYGKQQAMIVHQIWNGIQSRQC